MRVCSRKDSSGAVQCSEWVQCRGDIPPSFLQLLTCATATATKPSGGTHLLLVGEVEVMNEVLVVDCQGGRCFWFLFSSYVCADLCYEDCCPSMSVPAYLFITSAQQRWLI